MSFHYATVYKKDTGEIVQTGAFSCDDDFVQMNFAARVNSYGGATHDVMDVQADPETQYVIILDGVETLVDRPRLIVTLDKDGIAADGIDTATLTGLPDPCAITIDDDDPLTETTVVEVTGGGFTFSTEDPGPYSFAVYGRFPFLPFKTVIVAS